MNPVLGIKKLPLFDNTFSIILHLFLVKLATTYNIQHNPILTSRYHRNSEVQFDYHNDAAPFQPIHQNQSSLHHIKIVKNTTNDLIERLAINFNVHHRPKRSENEGPSLSVELDKTEAEIGFFNWKLRFLLQRNELLDKFKTRIRELESSVNNLQKSIDNVRRNMTKKVNANVNEISKITSHLSESVYELNYRINDLQDEIHFEAESQIPSEIVNDLKSHHFSEARRKLFRLNEDMYYNVLQEVYNHQASNFNLLLHFGSYITDIELKFATYDFLFKQTVAGGLNDPWKILRLRHSIKMEIINGNYRYLVAIKLHSLLKKLMEEAAVEPIYSAFLFDNSWTTVKQLSTEISEDCPECTNRIFNTVIKTIWNKITIDDILCRSHKNLNLRENMVVHLAVLNTLKRTSGLHNISVITFARFMKLTMEDFKYHNESLEKRSQYEAASNEIPEPVKNLVFSSAICIKDTAHNEYLYAGAAPYYVYDDERRHVYTWIPGDRDEPPKFKWLVSFHNSNEIALRNDNFNEYLYASDFTYDDTRRYVFTWRPGSTVTNGIWRVEIDGNYIHMLNTEHGGYLFADHNEMKDKSRRYVFTNRKGVKSPSSKWEIVDCSNFT